LAGLANYVNIEDAIMYSFVYTLFLIAISPCFSAQSTSSWQPAIDISTPATPFLDLNRQQELGVDEAGNAFAVWTTPNEEVFASRFDADQGTWSSPTQIGNSSASNPVLAATNDGKAIAIWYNTGDGNLHYNVYNGTWGSDASDLPITPSPRLPTIGVDATGHAIAVWYALISVFTNTMTFINSSVFDFSTMTWGPLLIVDSLFSNPNPTINFVGKPNLAVNDQGVAYAIWRAVVNSTTNEIRAAQYNGGWGGVEPVYSASDMGGTIFQILPNCALDFKNNAMAMWISKNDALGTFDVLSSYRLAGGGWQPADTRSSDVISANGVVPIINGPYLTSVAFDLTGEAVGVWPANDPSMTYQTIAAGAFDPISLSWSSPTTISESGSSALLPRIAVQGNGNAWAIWTQQISSSLEETRAAHFTKFPPSWELPSKLLSTRTINLEPDINTPSGTNISTNYSGCYFSDWPSSDSITGPFSLQASHISCESTPTPSTIQSPQKLLVCQKQNRFLTQTEYYNVLTWTPASSSNIKGYKIYRNGQQIAFVNSTTYCDHNQCPCMRTAYQVVAVDTKGNASSPLTFVLRSF
jgi:hypothetical protein